MLQLRLAAQVGHGDSTFDPGISGRDRTSCLLNPGLVFWSRDFWSRFKQREARRNGQTPFEKLSLLYIQ